MKRSEMLDAIRERAASRTPWDIAIIGGGATGLGAAVDAAARGFDVVLVEQSDFAKGTSSRSTKLVHGGVRYLQQGNISLVMEALKERGLLLRNAPHLVHDVPFIVPSYEWWESPFYGVGLKIYDLLAGKYGFGRSSHLSKSRVIEAIPRLNLTVCMAAHGTTTGNLTMRGWQSISPRPRLNRVGRSSTTCASSR